MRFRYPDNPGGQVIEVAPPAAQAGVAPETLNFAYSYSGAQGLFPARVFDDGRFTYFQFTATTETPAIYTLGADGREELVNAQTRGRFTVVDLTAHTFVLRNGRNRTLVRMNAPPALGQPFHANA